MRTLNELLDSEDPAFPLIRQWASEADIPVELLPPSAGRDDVLLSLQVTTRSPLGAIAYETGGILVDDGWLRILGSSHDKLGRNIATWNEGKAEGFLLVADDVLGGFLPSTAARSGPTRASCITWPPRRWNGKRWRSASRRLSHGPLAASCGSFTAGSPAMRRSLMNYPCPATSA